MSAVPGVVRFFAAVGLVHLALMGSLSLFVKRHLSVGALLVVNILNACVPSMAAAGGRNVAAMPSKYWPPMDADARR